SVTIAFQGALANEALNTMTVTNALTGGTTPSLSVATTTPGLFATTLNSGTLTLANGASLAAGGMQVIGGTLQASAAGGVTLTSPVTFNSSVASFAGNNPLFFTGTTTFNGASLLTLGNTGGVTFAGAVTGPGALALQGGTLYLTSAFGAASNFSGQ